MLTDTIPGISPAGTLRMSKSDPVRFVESSLRHHMTTSKEPLIKLSFRPTGEILS